MSGSERGLVSKLFNWGKPGPKEAEIKQDEEDMKNPQAAVARKNKLNIIEDSQEGDAENIFDAAARRRAEKEGQGFGRKNPLNKPGAMKGDKA